jgi:hypothetical protein
MTDGTRRAVTREAIELALELGRELDALRAAPSEGNRRQTDALAEVYAVSQTLADALIALPGEDS